MDTVEFVVVSPPEIEPVTLEEAKAHLRLIPEDESEDEAILRPMIGAAREFCEMSMGKSVAVQTLAAYPAAGKRVVPLPRPPVLSVESVTAYGADGSQTILDPAAYLFDEVAGTVTLPALPDGLRAANPVAIRYRAGYEKPPMTIRQAMLLLIGHWYENRETVVVGAIASIEVQLTVKTLLRQHKEWWF